MNEATDTEPSTTAANQVDAVVMSDLHSVLNDGTRTVIQEFTRSSDELTIVSMAAAIGSLRALNKTEIKRMAI